MSTTEVRNLQDRAEGQQRAVALGLALEDKQEERKTLVSENGRVGRRRSVMNSDTDSIETNKDEDDYQENAVEEGDGDGNGNADEVDGDRDGNGDGDGDGDEDEDGITGYKADLLFTKKDVKRGRTQSFQSVLSSASLKSLKQQTTSMSSNHPRSNSIISTASNANGGVTSKNFQSFIQAPVLSNISDLKNNDDVEIGQQLPFVDSKAKDSNGTNSSNEKSINSDDLEDQEIIWQQQNLTMNALKKLSLSPMPIHNDDNGNGSGGGNVGSSSISKTSSRAVSRKSSVAKIPTMERIIEPYKPAEVDLSTFASLTRQPKAGIPQVAQETQSQLQQPQKSQYQPQSQPQSQPQPQPQQKPQQPQQQQHSSPEQEQVQAQVKSQIQTQHASQAQLQPSQTSQTSQQMSTQSLGPGAPLSGLNPQLSAYHKELQENHLRSLKQQPTKIPAAVIPPQNMNIRRSLLLHMVKPQDSNSSHANSEFLNNESPNTPSNTSNTPSSSLQLKHLQQIKGFRSPMYIPAVLRKTGAERNNGSGCGMTNCESVESTSSISTNGVSNGTSKSNGQNTPAENGGGSGDDSQVSKSPNFSSRSSVSSIESNDSLSNSISPRLHGYEHHKHSHNNNHQHHHSRHTPTRRHWMKDESVTKCGIESCKKTFNFFERRHHCRKCGGIFCNEHTSHYLYINHLAQFTTGGRGTLSKVCDNCIEEYNDFIKEEFGVEITSTHNKGPRRAKSTLPLLPSKSSSTTSEGVNNATKRIHNNNDNNNNSNGSPLVYNPVIDKLGKLPTGSTPMHSMRKDSQPQRPEQLVGSVPANWSWSSF